MCWRHLKTALRQSGLKLSHLVVTSTQFRAIPDNLFGIAKKELLLEMLDSLSDGLSTSLEPELIDVEDCVHVLQGSCQRKYEAVLCRNG